MFFLPVNKVEYSHNGWTNTRERVIIQDCLVVVGDGAVGRLDGHEADLIHRAYARAVKLTNFVKKLLRRT